ncbi:Rrf2 family transcriptional regulator [Cognatiyoonia sp. IB215182]|uniref:Rrf2 family transcriptional regulator n=1 Tax=Cognatiyoonia sp. IB215182 TaxID=3097353 RepID=UPI002A16587B|nr:Rrf2 family transcriptional regulator [Cognatiyoonia sp. IB215182]MDX8355755.1 Rrf2 family transcriptional regulator [Cognatiyoonia sp. IB215182]
MKLSDGVEQAIHSVAMLASLEDNQVLSAAALAEFHGVSPSYLLKHLQTLSRSGILGTFPGPKGGYYLAQSPADISLLDVVLAVEGPEPAFRCKEIRRNGPNPVPDGFFTAPCQISAAMLRAERSYRAELKSVTISHLLADVQRDDDGTLAARSCVFLDANVRITPQNRSQEPG